MTWPCFTSRPPYLEFTRLNNPLEWLASNFSLQYQHWIAHQCHENKGNDHQIKKLLIVRQILLVSTFVNVQRTVWRICILMLGCRWLRHHVCHHPINPILESIHFIWPLNFYCSPNNHFLLTTLYLNSFLAALFISWHNSQSVDKVICRVEVHGTGIPKAARETQECYIGLNVIYIRLNCMQE